MIVNVVCKPLPFRGYKAKYKPLSTDGSEGNYYATDDYFSIIRILKLINEKRLDIKYLIIDDFGYTIMNSFMRKAHEKGYQKFTDIGVNAFNIFESIFNLRENLFCFVMMHTEIDTHGTYKPKTIGKLIDDKVCIEGKFTNIFHSLVVDGNYKFLTNNDGLHMAKTPMDMFDNLHIDNDLLMIVKTISDYNNEEGEI